MYSQLAQAEPIRIPGTTTVPDPGLLAKFDLLRQFLLMVLADWQREAAPRQQSIDSASSDGAITYEEASAFLELQPVFLKCLFSYAFFFIAAENAYSAVYDSLKPAARALSFPGPLLPHPTRPPLVQRLRYVRNWSIAHVASPRTRLANKEAATTWQPLTWGRSAGDRWDLDKMAFGSFRVVIRHPNGTIIDQSDEFEIAGFNQLHQVCDHYLSQYDEVCFNLLEAIRPYSLGAKNLDGA